MSSESKILMNSFMKARRPRLMFEDGHVLNANESFLELCGFTRDQLLEKDCVALFPNFSDRGTCPKLDLILADGTYRHFNYHLIVSEGIGQLILEDPDRPGRSAIEGHLKAILAITQRMSSHLVVDDILQDILQACHNIIHASSTIVFIMNKAGDALIPRLTDDPVLNNEENYEVPVGQGLTGLAVKQGRALICNDPKNDPRLFQIPGTPEVHTDVILSVPIKTPKSAWGAITIYRPLDRPFSQGDLEIVQILAGQAAALLTSTDLKDQVILSERQHRSLVENAATGLFRMASDGKILNVNPYILKLLGLNSATSIESAHLFGSTAQHQDFLMKLKTMDRVSNFEVRCLNSDGNLLDLSLSGRYFNDLTYSECVLVDITRKRELEHENVNRLSFLEKLLDKLPIAIAVLEPSGQLLRSNPAFDHLFLTQLMEQKNLDSDSTLFARLFTSIKEIDALWQDALTGSTGTVENLCIPHDFLKMSAPKFLSITALPIRSHIGVLTEVVFLFQDQTKRKALQSQLLQAQKMESIGALSSGLAHDFNNLLSGVLGNAHFIRTRVDDHDAIRHIGIIERAVGKASELTRQLLGFTRKRPEHIQSVDANMVVQECLDLFERSIGRNVSLVKGLSPNLPLAIADALQLEQALLNLLLNAADAVGKFGTIHVNTDIIGVSDEEANSEKTAGSYIQIEVHDSGPGIPEDIRDRIFDPFFTTKAEGKGSGLGLSMVYNIVHSHAGWVDLDSHPDLGTRFRIHFPTQGVAVEKTMGANYPTEKGELLVVVDDDEILLNMLRRILVGLGYNVKLFSSGEESLIWFKKNQSKVDLVIVDMVMPDMNGLEVYEELQTIQDGTKVLFCSGYVHDQRDELLSLPGVHGFLEKPFTLSHLSSTLRACFEQGDKSSD
jgi:PAS domain S-box-containing protein